MSDDTGVWTYAITESSHLFGPDGEVDLTWLIGVGEAKVRVTACADLTVLVSDVSLTEFGEAALRRNLKNLDWLDEVAREHHYVIDAAVRLFPLLPTGLGTVYAGDAALRAALARRQDQLRGTLRRVGGRVEWGVKAYAAAAADNPEVALAVGNAAAGETEPTGGAGLAYPKRRRDQLAADREVKSAAVRASKAMHADLAAKAFDTRLHPPQPAQLTGIRSSMLLNAAYLTDAADGPAFTGAVAGQATAHPELRVELTGPWPPYSFADDNDDGH